MIRYVIVDGSYTLNEELLKRALSFNGQTMLFKNRQQAVKFIASLEQVGLEPKDLYPAKVSVKLLPQD